MGTYAVTGSASGMGQAVAQKLRANGHTVIGVDIKEADVVADLSTPAGRRAAAEGVLAASDRTLTGAVLAAGLGPGVGAERPRLITEVNYFGVVELLDVELPRAAGGGVLRVLFDHLAPKRRHLVCAPGLGEDIGEALGCGAYLVSLRRTVTGDFDQSRCVSLEALEALPEGERLASLMPVQTLLTHHTRVTLDSQNAGRFLSGMRRRGTWADAKAVAVFGDEPPALLGVGHTLAGELIPERLLSPIEIQQILENMERTHGSEGNRTEETI